MTRDYKPSSPKKKSSGSPFFTGLMLGLLFGVCGTVALLLYLKGNNPFLDTTPPSLSEKKSEDSKRISETTIKPGTKDDSPLNDPNKFDFYTILPDTESKVTEQEVKGNTTIKQDSYFLQVGAFENESDADNMKAKLALQGFEAVVQTAEIPEKGIWHRVRVGPLTDVEQINKIRAELLVNGFNADLIKVHTESKTD